MVNLLLFIIAVIGFCHVLVDSSFFAPVREWLRNRNEKLPWSFISKVLSCYQCCGVWSGWFCGLCLLTHLPVTPLDYVNNFATVFMAGFAGSFLSSWAAEYFTYLQAKQIIELPKENQ